MRYRLLAAWILTVAGLAAQSIDGRVVNSATGAAIPDATVTIFRDGGAVLSATTDVHGNFHASDVPEGAYTACFKAEGYRAIPESCITQPFEVTRAAQHPLEIKMRPVAKLSGRVISAAGKPIPKATVGGYSREGSVVFQANEKGEFQTPEDLAAGTWILFAAAPGSFPPPESPDGQRLGWALTYYPREASVALASPVSVAAGGAVSELEIKLITVPVYRLRGIVLDPRGDPTPAAHISLSAIGVPSPGERPVTTTLDGSFEFPSVASGEYWLTSTVTRKGAAALISSRRLQMSKEDVENVKVQLAEPFAVQGKIEIEIPEDTAAPKLPAVEMGTLLISSFEIHRVNSAVAHPDATGVFTFQNVYPGDYQITPGSAPAPYYLDSITLGGRDALASNVEIDSGALPIGIRYKLHGGSVHGTVENCASGTVWLLPQDAPHRRDGFNRIVSCDPKGRYAIDNVRPGEYYALAIPPEVARPMAAPILLRLVLGTIDQNVINQAARISVRTNESTLADLSAMTQ